MKKIKREITLFFFGTIYMWTYYFLSVLMNPKHPMDEFVPIMIIGSFFGLPILMFIILPLINGVIVSKIFKVNMIFRTVAYLIISCFMLSCLFSLHMTLSNYSIKQKLFPEGIESAAMKHFNTIQENTKGEVKLLSYYYTEPFHSSIDAGNMSGTTNPSIRINYEFVDCSSDDCDSSYTVRYDSDTAESTTTENIVNLSERPLSINKDWADEFVGEYIGAEDGLRYTLFVGDHGTDGYKLYFRRFDPYLNFDTTFKQVEPSYGLATIIEVTSHKTASGYQTVSSLNGKEIEFIKTDEGVEVKVDGKLHTSLVHSER